MKAYSQKKIGDARKALSRYMDTHIQNTKNITNVHGVNIRQDFTRHSMKRTIATDTVFNKSDFTRAALTGSKFERVVFKNCILRFTNLQFSDFIESTFTHTDRNSLVVGSGFGQSVFFSSLFDGVTFRGCGICSSLFENTVFRNCIFQSSTLEQSIFRNCIFENVEMSNTNAEYVMLHNNNMTGVRLSFHQIPYIMGAIEAIKKQDNDITIGFSEKAIAAEEYFALFPHLEAYYYSLDELFPLSNILAATGKKDEAYDFLSLGIEKSIIRNDFRRAKYFCLLAVRNNLFSAAENRKLYELLDDCVYRQEFSIAERSNYLLHSGEIRNILLNNDTNRQRFEISIKTDINTDQLEKLSFLLNCINVVFSHHSSREHSHFVELRHNSPYDIFISAVDNSENILVSLSAIYGMLHLIDKGNTVLQRTMQTIRDACATWSELGFNKQAKRMKELDIHLKELEIKKLENDLSDKELKISFPEISHKIHGLDDSNVHSENKTATQKSLAMGRVKMQKKKRKR